MSEPHRDRSGKTVPILTVLIIVIAALGVGGTLMGFTQARRARQMATMQRAMAEESRARAVAAEPRLRPNAPRPKP